MTKTEKDLAYDYINDLMLEDQRVQTIALLFMTFKEDGNTFGNDDRLIQRTADAITAISGADMAKVLSGLSTLRRGMKHYQEHKRAS